MKKNTILLTLMLLIIIITISVIYNTFPRLQLNGKINMVLSYRDDYQEPGVIVKNANNNYLSKVKIDSNIDDDTIGNYYVDYSLKLGIRQLHVRRNVKIIDNIAPIIKLKGEQIVEMSLNDNYQEPGYKALDEYDGDLTERVQISGEIDTSNYGEYVIKYKVTDNSNNTVEVNRIVKIIDEVAPKFECKSDYSALKIGSKNIVGCKAIDNFDGDITDKVQVTGIYDTNKKGIYKVEYQVKDDAGNTASITHNIIIFEEKEDPMAYLSFNEELTEQTKTIIEILKENNVNATFFINKQENEENNTYLSEIIENGNELGIYGYSNKEESYNNIDDFKSYFEQTKKLIYEKTDKPTKIYRFKDGSNSNNLTENMFKTIKEYLDKNEITYYDWNIKAVDKSSESKTKDEIKMDIINQLLQNKDKQITILFDDTETKQVTAEVLPEIIEILKEMNYSFDLISNSNAIKFRK